MKREEAYELLHKYMKGENYIQHSMAVEAIMRGLAKRLAPEDVEYWGIAGLLHDLDEEQHHQQTHAQAPAPVDELHFSLIQGLVFHLLDFFVEFDFFVFHHCSPLN